MNTQMTHIEQALSIIRNEGSCINGSVIWNCRCCLCKECYNSISREISRVSKIIIAKEYLSKLSPEELLEV